MITIKEKTACSGCGACSVVCYKGCIRMVTDEEGFLYPAIDKTECIDCMLCDNVCPIKSSNKPEIKEVECYAAYNVNNEDRKNSSSGGIFIAMARNIINNDGVVFGAAFDEHFNLKHIVAKEISELISLMGSKYLQSRTAESYLKVKNYLMQNKLVLFSGTPCQIAGLKGFLGKEYENLILVDIICHGVPSPKFYMNYKSFLEKKYNSKITSFDFRNKKFGWKNYCVRIVFENGKEIYEEINKNIYMKAFLKNICLRPSCYNCAFKSIPKHSDLTIGDFWGCDNILNEKNDDKGISLILVNTQKGESFLKNIREELYCISVDGKEALQFNPAANKSVDESEKRDVFFKMLNQKKLNYIIKKLCDDKFFYKLKSKVKYEFEKLRK